MHTLTRNQSYGLIAGIAVALYWAILQSPGGLLGPSIRNVSPLEANALIKQDKPLIIDVREHDAFQIGHVPGAVVVPIDELDTRMKEFAAHRAETVLVYCGDGSKRGPTATHKLNENGYTGAVNIEGGMRGWREAGLPVEQGK